MHWHDLQYLKSRPKPRRTLSLPALIDRSAWLGDHSDDGEAHFLNPGGHRLQLTRDYIRRSGWTCSNCSSRESYGLKEPSYRCDLCDFDLCRNCWDRIPEPRSAGESAVAVAGDGVGQGTANQRAPKLLLRCVARLLSYGKCETAKCIRCKWPHSIPTSVPSIKTTPATAAVTRHASIWGPVGDATLIPPTTSSQRVIVGRVVAALSTPDLLRRCQRTAQRLRQP